MTEITPKKKSDPELSKEPSNLLKDENSNVSNNSKTLLFQVVEINKIPHFPVQYNPETDTLHDILSKGIETPNFVKNFSFFRSQPIIDNVNWNLQDDLNKSLRQNGYNGGNVSSRSLVRDILPHLSTADKSSGHKIIKFFVSPKVTPKSKLFPSYNRLLSKQIFINTQIKRRLNVAENSQKKYSDLYIHFKNLFEDEQRNKNELQKETNFLRVENERYKSKNKELESRVGVLTKKNENKKNEIKQMKKVAKQKKKILREMEDDIVSKNGKILRMKEEFKNVKSVTKKAEMLRKSLDVRNMMLEESRRNVDDLNAKVDVFMAQKKRVSELESHLKHLKKENEKLISSNDVYANKISRNDGYIKKLVKSRREHELEHAKSFEEVFDMISGVNEKLETVGDENEKVEEVRRRLRNVIEEMKKKVFGKKKMLEEREKRERERKRKIKERIEKSIKMRQQQRRENEEEG